MGLLKGVVKGVVKGVGVERGTGAVTALRTHSAAADVGVHTQ